MRSRPALRTAALAAALLASTLTAQATTASADAAAPAPVTTQAVFNNPVGTAAEQQAVVARQVELIAGAPAGARIRLAMFYADDPALPDALIAAHRRGVDVQAVFDEKAVSMAPYKSLLAELGGDTAKASWVMSCGAGRGCVGTRALGTVDAINHNKFLLLSETQGTPHVVVQSSANLHVGRDGTKGWNNALVLAGNEGIYAAYNGYFDDLRARRANNDYYSTGRPPVASGNAKAHFYPRAESNGAPYNDPSEDTVATVLDNVKCFGNSKYGTTDNHRTRIRVSMTIFSRPYLADRLAELDAQGCYVEVSETYNPDSALEKQSLETLLKKTSSVYGGVITKYYCQADSTWIHDKYLLVEGNYYNTPDRKVLWTGSHNWSGNSLRQSDETMLQLEDSAVFDSYVANFNQLRAATTHQPANGAAATC
ncbi:phosphatidylserine/phosphatidylglycerophosphate/cardiolipin synthase family protein [Streptomyces melanogenes]|uniref:phosphatidylserine/phosphatidylglycerophosphate/ cardiolipin synthase family protein n=1 Tax=Streptomyces melanogenes TaxID=67326 RepID=UPI00379ED7A7